MKNPTHAAGGTREAAQTARHRLPNHPATLAPATGPGADADHPFEEGVHDTLDPDLRYRLISEAAFKSYAERGFEDGHDVEDWLAAEEKIDHLQAPARPGEDETGT